MEPQKQGAGSLVIAGSGFLSIAQFTLETVMYIEQADKVFYCVPDAVTEGFIHSKNSNSVDLYEYYSNTKPRSETYIQMAEVRIHLSVINALHPFTSQKLYFLHYNSSSSTDEFDLAHVGTCQKWT
jgi:hypothetical protein